MVLTNTRTGNDFISGHSTLNMGNFFFAFSKILNSWNMLRLSRGNVHFWHPFAHQLDCEKLGTFWWVTNEMDSNSCCNGPEGSVSLVRCYPSTKMKGHSAFFPLSAPVHCDRWYWLHSVIGQHDLARSAFIDAMAMFFWQGPVHYLCSWQDELPHNFFLVHCNILRI